MKISPSATQKSFACLLMTLAATLTSLGMPFYGTITETITSTNDSSFHVGQTFIGSYCYDSSTADGVFGRGDRQHDQAINTLSGLLFNWNPHLADCLEQDDIGGLGGLLTVSNDTVTGFNFDGDRSFGQFWFSATTFGWSGYFPNQTGISTYGTLCFSSPVAVPEGAACTAGLMVFSLISLVFFGRRFAG